MCWYALGPVLLSKRSRHNESPGTAAREWPPCATARVDPAHCNQTAMHSSEDLVHELKTKRKSPWPLGGNSRILAWHTRPGVLALSHTVLGTSRCLLCRFSHVPLCTPPSPFTKSYPRLTIRFRRESFPEHFPPRLLA